MPSSYTTNSGFEKPAPGEQTGTWGGTLNTNFDLIDVAVNGVTAVTLASEGSTGTPNTLDITDGAVDDGLYRYIEIDETGTFASTAYLQLTPNSAQKIVIIENNCSDSLEVFQGTYNSSRSYVIPAGETAYLYFDGGGASAANAANALNNLRLNQILAEDNIQLETTTVGTYYRLRGGAGPGDDLEIAYDGATILTYDESETTWDFEAADITTTGNLTCANISGTNTGDNVSATDSVEGIIELATQAEVDAGTDTTRAVTPDTLANFTGLGDPTPLTTKGDIYTFSSVDARLAVGTDGQVLTADSGEATGLGWTTISTGGLGSVVEDTSPQLGGTLESNDFDIYLQNRSSIRFYESDSNGTNYVIMRAPALLSSNYTLTLPTGDGAAGRYLKTDGSGTLSWDDPGSASAFTDLTDTPSSYSGDGSKFVKVNSGATGLEFVSGTFVESIVAGAGIDVSGSGTVTVSGEDASTTNAGIVELATIAETNTGTDDTRAVTPDGLDGWTGSSNITTVGDIGAVLDSDFSSNGLMVRTTGPAYTSRTITGGDGISISNGNGVSGDPEVSATYTVSTSAPSGTPADGTVWYRY